jgi:hypothetical protein
MRLALAEFESQQRKLSCSHASTAAAGQANRPARMPPRQTAFYAALRSVLQQVLAETTSAGRMLVPLLHASCIEDHFHRMWLPVCSYCQSTLHCQWHVSIHSAGRVGVTLSPYTPTECQCMSYHLQVGIRGC